jgi:hypothetical protein
MGTSVSNADPDADDIDEDMAMEFEDADDIDEEEVLIAIVEAA